jgi:hypothetical protein
MPATAGLATNFYPRQIACASGYRDQAWPAPRLPHRRVRLLLDVGHRRPRPWACGQRRGSSDLQIRTRSCGMDRACAAAEFQRGQGASWGHHQSRQRLSAADGHGRGDGGDPLRPAQQCTPALARPAHGSPPKKGRGYRTRQQDRPNGVGPNEQRRTLSRSAGNAGDRADGGIETKRGCSCADEVGKGRRELMQQAGRNRRIRRTHIDPAPRVRASGRDLIRGWHSGQRLYVPHKQVGHWSHQPALQRHSKALANGRPSTQGRIEF